MQMKTIFIFIYIYMMNTLLSVLLLAVSAELKLEKAVSGERL